MTIKDLEETKMLQEVKQQFYDNIHKINNEIKDLVKQRTILKRNLEAVQEKLIKKQNLGQTIGIDNLKHLQSKYRIAILNIDKEIKELENKK